MAETLSDHIEKQDAGTFLIVRPTSDAARAWFAAHVREPDPGGQYVIEHRFARDIFHAAARDLLSWQ